MALAWLRENGRYLTPVGAGDLMYAIAITIRNWFSVQYVIGTVIASAFALILVLRMTLAHYSPDTYAGIEQWLLDRALAAPGNPCETCGAKVVLSWWFSPILATPVIVFLLCLAPLGIAFWLTHAKRRQSDAERARIFSAAAWAALVIVVVLGVLAYVGRRRGVPENYIYVARAAGALTLLGFLWHAATALRPVSVSKHRVLLTRQLATWLQVFLALIVIGVVDTLSQSLYLAWSRHPDLSAIVSPAALTAGGVWLVRAITRLADRGSIPGALTKIPIGVIAGAAGVVLLLLIGMLWGFAFHGFLWRGEIPVAIPTSGDDAGWLAACLAVVVVLAFFSGRFPGFLNLSSLQSLYGARLTRAYLGGTNKERFVATDDTNRALLSAAEPVKSDQIDLKTYYDTLAPLHIINVTVNQTIDPTEQLVQRDRKGRPMAILPTGFSIDRWHYELSDEVDGDAMVLGTRRLSIGQWVGTSGAAFSTGLGRATSLGVSLVLGLANVRLGTWWSSGFGKDASTSFERVFKAVFKTQTFLFYEFMAKFHGLRREWQYLSDGGHFENTGLYELLRPGRNLDLIVVCDDGADPDYEFGDLANLIRLARIDHGVDIQIDQSIAEHEQFKAIFGTPKDFVKGAPANDKCAILLNVYSAETGARTCRIILLKPRVIASAPADVQEYATTHSTFPQETTTDQFFDQAQWESYRKLGLTIGGRVFGGREAAALWTHLFGAGG